MRARSFANLLACLIAMQCIAAEETTSRFGPDDRVGAINFLTPALTKQAMRLVKTGQIYSLAIEVRPETPEQSKVEGRRGYNVSLQPIELSVSNKITGFDDRVMLSPGLGTTMDGLGHAGRSGVHYNGVRAEEINSPEGAKIFSIAAVPPIVARGVLLDVAHHRGVALVPEGTAIGPAEIKAVCKAQRVTLQQGDVVLLHTGWLELMSKDPDRYGRGEPGLSIEGALYLASLGVVAVGADNAGVEVNPAEVEGEYAPVHQALLVDHGIYLFENVNTTRLAGDRAYEFLFISAASRLAGTVQANVHPIAIR